MAGWVEWAFFLEAAGNVIRGRRLLISARCRRHRMQPLTELHTHCNCDARATSKESCLSQASCPV